MFFQNKGYMPENSMKKKYQVGEYLLHVYKTHAHYITLMPLTRAKKFPCRMLTHD